MNIRVFTTNNAGKIEFTKCELEKLLNNTYAEGFENGMAVANTHPTTPTAPFVRNDNVPECVAETKMPDLNANDIEAAMSMIAGTARSMGVVVAD